MHPIVPRRLAAPAGAAFWLGLTLMTGAAVMLQLRPPAPPHAAMSAIHPMAAHGMAATAATGRAKARIVSEEKLAHVPGKTVTVEIVELPPGLVGREHHHAGSVTVYVLEGTVRSQLAGGPVLDYHPGDTFFEPLGTVHLFAANPSMTEPAKFMAIHVADDGAQLTTYH